jgi:hypothetical protein
MKSWKMKNPENPAPSAPTNAYPQDTRSLFRHTPVINTVIYVSIPSWDSSSGHIRFILGFDQRIRSYVSASVSIPGFGRCLGFL